MLRFIGAVVVVLLILALLAYLLGWVDVSTFSGARSDGITVDVRGKEIGKDIENVGEEIREKSAP